MRWSFAVAVGALFGAAASRFPVDDSDVFWHLASGRWMAEHGELLRLDVFSSTIPGAPVPLHQWLGQLMLWAAFALGSWWGVLALRVLAVTVLATLVMGTALGRARPALAAAVAVPALFVSRFVWGDRPELASLVCFSAFVPLALSARSGARLAQVALVPLMAFWTNLHGGFVVGVMLLVLLSIEALVFARPNAARFAAASALACLSTLVNPLGPIVYASPAYHFTTPPRFIQEWGTPDVATLPGLLYALALLGSFALAAIQPSRRTSDVALLAPLAFLSLSALRQMPLLALAAAPFAAERLQALVGARPAPSARTAARVAVLFATVVLAVALAGAQRAPDLSAYPTGALPALRAEPGRLFNDYDWGGFLIWEAPEHPVFVDGRLVPYIQTGVLAEYREAIGVHERWREVLDRHGIDLVLVRPAASLATRLREGGWSTRYADATAVLLRRP